MMDDLVHFNLAKTAISDFGTVVFVVSGALTAGRYRMDLLGFILIGTITGIGGGTLRDMLLGQRAFWVGEPRQLVLCVVVALITFFFISGRVDWRRGMIWADALGLSAFAVLGCQLSLEAGASWPVAVFLGMLTATGGGVARDVLTNTQPMILSGQLYATAALAGAGAYAVLHELDVPRTAAEAAAFAVALALRAAAIRFDIRMGPPSEFIRLGRRAAPEGDDGEG